MNTPKIYQYAVIWHPDEEQTKEGKKSEIIISPEFLLANDERSALITLSRSIPEKYLDQLDHLEIAIRPF
jgi:hypothetical protein